MQVRVAHALFQQLHFQSRSPQHVAIFTKRVTDRVLNELLTRGLFGELVRDLAKTEFELKDLHHRMGRALIFREAPTARPTFIHQRGEWDRTTEQVQRGTPGFLPPMPPNAPNNRLGLAQWMMSPSHPLTARVAVNRLWQQLFGIGLVRTGEDFGTRAQRPNHPELLDWLAVDFRESGWDIKRLMRLMVTSATYRQSARLTPELAVRDPENRLLARSSRRRLDAETLRDQALALGGILVDRLGGPIVKPPQPSGVWEAVSTRNSNTKYFVADTETDKIYRRSLYTFWKRTAHSPQMNLLDAPSRETSVCCRERTNTPLQALLLLNELQFMDAARGLARRAIASPFPLEQMFYLATARMPDEIERAELHRVFDDHREHFTEHPDLATQLMSDPIAPSDLAALTMIANLILNPDEVLNRP